MVFVIKCENDIDRISSIVDLLAATDFSNFKKIKVLVEKDVFTERTYALLRSQIISVLLSKGLYINGLIWIRQNDKKKEDGSISHYEELKKLLIMQSADFDATCTLFRDGFELYLGKHEQGYIELIENKDSINEQHKNLKIKGNGPAEIRNRLALEGVGDLYAKSKAGADTVILGDIATIEAGKVISTKNSDGTTGRYNYISSKIASQNTIISSAMPMDKTEFPKTSSVVAGCIIISPGTRSSKHLYTPTFVCDDLSDQVCVYSKLLIITPYADNKKTVVDYEYGLFLYNYLKDVAKISEQLEFDTDLKGSENRVLTASMLKKVYVPTEEFLKKKYNYTKDIKNSLKGLALKHAQLLNEAKIVENEIGDLISMKSIN